MPDRGVVGRVGVGTFEVTDPGSAHDFSDATIWQQVALLDGAPLHDIAFASPGEASARLVDAMLRLRVSYWWSRELLFRELCDYLDVSEQRSGPRVTISVVVCTHGRPEYLPRLFDSLSALDPSPVEVIVVDNAPGDNDCRDDVESRGFRYVREDRKGLDNARNAGIRAATGELVAFTDDDCVLEPGWLREMSRLFSDKSVAAVTGPMFPFALETRSQQRMNEIAGMVRGFDELEFDWHNLSVAHGGAAGVGANMTIRRAALDELGVEPFPPELDTGTPTGSGGDTYVFGRLIGNGHRIVYAPTAYGFHDHRGDDQSLRRAVHGYGLGVSAAMTRLLLIDREFEAWKGWFWLAKQQVVGCWRWLSGRADRRALGVSLQYVRGGLRGPDRWLASRSAQSAWVSPTATRTQSHAESSPQHARPSTESPPTAANIRISVVIPTTRFGGPLSRCLSSLSRQTLSPDEFEVLVVDDRRRGGPDGDLGSVQQLRVLRANGRGAAAARNLGAASARGDVVLFLDDDMVAAPGLLARHLADHDDTHDSAALAVVGAYPPRPRERGLTADSSTLWWQQHFESFRHSHHKTFTWFLSGNLSVRRESFLRLGGFAEHMPHRREDYELGLRWMGAGFDIVYDEAATADHEYTQSTAARLRAVELEGIGDAVMNRLHPGISGTLPLISRHDPHRVSWRRWAAGHVLGSETVRRTAQNTLSIAEGLKLRGLWLTAFRPLNSTAYARGLERGGFALSEIRETLIECDLADPRPIRPDGGIAPSLRVTFGGEELFIVRPTSGLWDSDIPRRIVAQLSGDVVSRVGRSRGWLPDPDARHEKHSGLPSRKVVPLPLLATAELWQREIESTSDEVLVVTMDAARDDKWLDEALLAFDGARVAAAFGRPVAADLSAQPVWLYGSTMRPTNRSARQPVYFAFRVSCLRAEMSSLFDGLTDDALTLALGVTDRLLDAGFTVAERDVRRGPGLAPSSPLAFGRAAARVELARRTNFGWPIAARQILKAWALALSDRRHHQTGLRIAASEATGRCIAALETSRRQPRTQSAPSTSSSSIS